MSLELGSLGLTISVFVTCAGLILLAGVKLTHLADTLSKRTSLGPALMGAVLLGGTTSLPGIITSVSTAWQGFPDLATSNAIGGIAAQTVFLIFADIIYRKANLEHAAASVENLVQCSLLIAMLAIVMVGTSGPSWTVFAIHPVSFFILVAYFFGLKLVNDCKAFPGWTPRNTSDTEPEGKMTLLDRSLSTLWFQFALCGLVVGLAGYGIGETGIAISKQTGLSQTVVGTLLTSTATSLPELVTVLAAVRMGALALAVGDIIGGNAFDVLFLAFADFAFREGSIYHRINNDTSFLLSVSLLMSVVVLLGLLRRERRGLGNIGFEGVITLGLYAWAVWVITTGAM